MPYVQLLNMFIWTADVRRPRSTFDQASTVTSVMVGHEFDFWLRRIPIVHAIKMADNGDIKISRSRLIPSSILQLQKCQCAMETTAILKIYSTRVQKLLTLWEVRPCQQEWRPTKRCKPRHGWRNEWFCGEALTSHQRWQIYTAYTR